MFLGAGMWRPASDALKSIRDRFSDKPTAWEHARDDREFARHFQLRGETLTRPPRGFDKEHPQIEGIKRKDFIAIKNMTIRDALSPKFQRNVETAFRAADPYMRFLCKAVNVQF